jgi:hypothetical protein
LIPYFYFINILAYMMQQSAAAGAAPNNDSHHVSTPDGNKLPKSNIACDRCREKKVKCKESSHHVPEFSLRISNVGQATEANHARAAS